MLNIYSRNSRPEKAIDAIIAATADYPEKTLKKGQKVITADTNYVHILIRGEIEIRRRSDELSMFTMRHAGFLGVSAVYNRASHMYGITRDTSVIRTIKREESVKIISGSNLAKFWSGILIF